MKTLVICLCFMSIAYAQPSGDHKPPFVTACSSLSAGDSCSFSNREGSTISGTCTEKENPRGESELVCWNESEMQNMGGGRPPRGDRSER